MQKHPFFFILFALYPPLALLTWNLREIDPFVVIRPFIFSAVIAGLFFAISMLLIRNQSKALLVSTVLIIFFFSFGHMMIFAAGWEIPAFAKLGFRMSSVTAIFMLSALFVMCRSILLSSRDLSKIYPALNAVSVFLVLSSCFLLITKVSAQQTNIQQGNNNSEPASATGPDVYYIILDAYGRQDALKSLGYDNSDFIGELEELGFYVAECSRSNYPQTVMSMASSLNMGYLWDVLPNQGANDRNSEPVYAGILHSQVRREFEAHGYQIIAFDSGVNWLNWHDADQFVRVPPESFFSLHLDPFEYLFLETTALQPLMNQPFFLTKKYVHNYNRILFMLDELPKIAAISGPKFVYVHMLIPHRPNIFLPDGSMNLDTDYYIKGVGEGINRQYDIEGYINNTRFINDRLPDVIQEILQNSETPPIVIIQGDHGYQLPAIRFDILNAYLFPGGDYTALYQGITPANTFRVIFNTFFETDYSILEDQSIDVGINRPYGKKNFRTTPCP